MLRQSDTLGNAFTIAVCAAVFLTSAFVTLINNPPAPVPPTATATPTMTHTPTPTSTHTPNPTPTATQIPPTPYVGLRSADQTQFVVRLTYYWPALGGTNCYPTNWKNGKCESRLMGEPWSTWVNIGAACSADIPLRSRIFIERLNKSYMCVDRGGGIIKLPDGSQFVDLLQQGLPKFKNWKEGIVVDKYCPSGCYTSKAWLLD